MNDEKTEKKKTDVLTKQEILLEEALKIKTLPEISMIGQSVPRTDAYAKATGKLTYVDDLPQDGFLHGKILRSPHSHALIKSINTEKAKKLAGVIAVLTAQDVPGRNGFGLYVPDQPVICGDKVRFVGDGVALVAAESEERAVEALSLIEVEYELLPSVYDPREALKSESTYIHGKSNLLSHNKLRKGDVENGFGEADLILERSYEVPFGEHAYLEPDVAMAIPQQDDTMLVQGPMQVPFSVRRNLAAVLDVPISNVRVRQISTGGAFGGKVDTSIDLGCRAAVLAAATGQPIRMALEREEVTLQTVKRHPHFMQIKIGAKEDGSLVAFEGTIYNEQGAYASVGPLVPPAAGVNIHSTLMMPGPYEIPNCKVDSYLCLTNNPPGGAMRGFGAPQVCFAHESIMDELALELGISPFDIRRKNALKLYSVTPFGQSLDQSVGLIDTLDACAKKFDWQRRYSEPGSVKIEDNKYRGVGIAMGWYRTSGGYSSDGCGANVYVHEDGSVLVSSGIVEMGQGSHTVLRQICAEELGVRLDDVRLVQPDTDLVPESGPTVASRSTTLMGNAIILAARQVKESVLDMAAQMLAVSLQKLEVKAGYIYDRENASNFLNFKDVAAKCMATGKRLIGQGWWTPPTASLDSDTGQGNPYFVYTYSTQMAEVIVDDETGQVEVTDYVAAFDIGKAINPQLVEGQIEGGVAMGLGYALMEEVILQDGHIQNIDLRDFLVPTSLDVPKIDTAILEIENKLGPFGAKGMGEMPNIPVAPAVVNAIANACNARIRSLPAHPEKVQRAIEEVRQADRK
jgi:CO/xanthine dehydrogenase Mo-binding subunit